MKSFFGILLVTVIAIAVGLAYMNMQTSDKKQPAKDISTSGTGTEESTTDEGGGDKSVAGSGSEVTNAVKDMKTGPSTPEGILSVSKPFWATLNASGIIVTTTGSTLNADLKALGIDYAEIEKYMTGEEHTKWYAAIKAMDSKLCLQLSEKKYADLCSDEITMELFRKTKDEALCSKLITDPFKTECANMVARESDTLNYKRAVRSGDSQYCNKIRSTSEKASCLEITTLKTALSKLDATLCKTLWSAQKITDCETSISNVIKSNQLQ